MIISGSERASLSALVLFGNGDGVREGLRVKLRGKKTTVAYRSYKLELYYFFWHLLANGDDDDDDGYGDGDGDKD